MSQRLKKVNESGAYWELVHTLKSVTKKPLLNLYLDEDHLSDDERVRWERCIQTRVGGKPLAYITGEAPFLDFSLKVGPGTFIPRPETEVLVREAIKWCLFFSSGREPLKALDLGSGSGNIAIGVSREIPFVSIDAVEHSSRAIRFLKQNIQTYHLQDRVHVFKMDYTQDAFRSLPGRYDLILANPPYISADDYKGLSPEVKREPVSALIGGHRGDEMIKWILYNVGSLLRTGGVLICEVGQGQFQELISTVGRIKEFRFLEMLKDDQAIERVMVVRKES